MKQNAPRISGKAWVGILVATTIITIGSANGMDDPSTGVIIVIAVIAFAVSLFGWALASLGWDAERKLRD